MKSALLFLLLITEALSQTATCTCARPLEVGTLNTEQIVLATLNQERLNGAIQLFLNQNLDIGCAQELWDPYIRNQFLRGISPKYPYNVTAPRVTTNCTAGCNADEVDRLARCLGAENCLVLEGFEFISCFVSKCRNVHDSLSHKCQSCIGLRTGIDINQKLRQCGGFSDVASSQCIYLFGGESDAVLFSKQPFVVTDHLRFSSSPYVNINVVYGQIIFQNQRVHAFCTHLSADLPFVNNQPANLNQVRQLINYVNSKVPSGELAFVIGDFNTGPAVTATNVQAAWVTNYNTLASTYNSVYVSKNLPSVPCTRCRDNPLVGIESSGSNTIIDHIFVNKPNVSPGFCVVQASRWALERIVRASGNMYPVSDHYGVKASFCLNSTSARAANV